MIEETDYSEEAKYDLFESVYREKTDWIKCIMARTPPSYEDVKKEMEKKKRTRIKEMEMKIKMFKRDLKLK